MEIQTYHLAERYPARYCGEYVSEIGNGDHPLFLGGDWAGVEEFGFEHLEQFTSIQIGSNDSGRLLALCFPERRAFIDGFCGGSYKDILSELCGGVESGRFCHLFFSAVNENGTCPDILTFSPQPPVLDVYTTGRKLPVELFSGF